MITAAVLTPPAHAEPGRQLADSIEGGLIESCSSTNRFGNSQFFSTGCEKMSSIAINLNRKQAIVTDPSLDFLKGVELLGTTGLRHRYDSTAKILQLDWNQIDKLAVKRIFSENGLEFQFVENYESQIDSSVEFVEIDGRSFFKN